MQTEAITLVDQDWLFGSPAVVVEPTTEEIIETETTALDSIAKKNKGYVIRSEAKHHPFVIHINAERFAKGLAKVAKDRPISDMCIGYSPLTDVIRDWQFSVNNHIWSFFAVPSRYWANEVDRERFGLCAEYAQVGCCTPSRRPLTGGYNGR